MAKKIDGYIKLQIAAGQANPSPPVGPALGQKGVNIMDFCKAFNAATQKLEAGMPIPVTITVFQDKSFIFETKQPPVSFFIKKVLLCTTFFATGQFIWTIQIICKTAKPGRPFCNM